MSSIKACQGCGWALVDFTHHNEAACIKRNGKREPVTLEEAGDALKLLSSGHTRCKGCGWALASFANHDEAVCIKRREESIERARSVDVRDQVPPTHTPENTNQGHSFLCKGCSELVPLNTHDFKACVAFYGKRTRAEMCTCGDTGKGIHSVYECFFGKEHATRKPDPHSSKLTAFEDICDALSHLDDAQRGCVLRAAAIIYGVEL